jgi:hypothetical protein
MPSRRTFLNAIAAVFALCKTRVADAPDAALLPHRVPEADAVVVRKATP